MTALAKITVTAILISNAAFSQQSATPKSQTQRPVATTFLGRYYGHVPESGWMSEMKWMFQDTSCHKYLLQLSTGDLELSTKGFFLITGSLVGNTLRITKSEKADETTSDRARKLLSKCPEPK